MADRPPRRRRGSPADLGAILAELAGSVGDSRLRQVSVAAAVADAMGPFLARRLMGLTLDGDRCAVQMRDHAAASEVARHAPLVLERLRRRLGQLAPTSLHVSEAPLARGLLPPLPPPVPGSPAVNLPLAQRSLALVEDPAERELLRRWLSRAPAPPIKPS